MLLLRTTVYFIYAHIIKCKAIQWSESPQRVPDSLRPYNQIDGLRFANNTANKPFTLSNFTESNIYDIIRHESRQRKIIKNRKIKRNAISSTEDNLKKHKNDTVGEVDIKNNTVELNRNSLKKNIVLQSNMEDTKEFFNVNKSKPNFRFSENNLFFGESLSYIVAISITLGFLILIIMSALVYTGVVTFPAIRSRSKSRDTRETKKLRYKEVAAEEEERNSIVNSNSWKTTFFMSEPESSCKNSVQENANSLRNEAVVHVSRTPSIQELSTKSSMMKSSTVGKESCEEHLNVDDDEVDESSTMATSQGYKEISGDASDSEGQDEFNDKMSLCQKCKGAISESSIIKRINEIESKGGRIHIPISIPVALGSDQVGKSINLSSSSIDFHRSKSITPSSRRREFSVLQTCSSTMSSQGDYETSSKTNLVDDDCKSKSSCSSVSTSKSKSNEDGLSNGSTPVPDTPQKHQNRSVPNKALSKLPPRKPSRISDSVHHDYDSTTSKTNGQSGDQGEYDYVSSCASEVKSTRSECYQVQHDRSASKVNQQPNRGDYECISSGKIVAKSSQSGDHRDQTLPQSDDSAYDTSAEKNTRSDVFQSKCSTFEFQMKRPRDNCDDNYCQNYSTTKTDHLENLGRNKFVTFKDSNAKMHPSSNCTENQSEYEPTYATSKPSTIRSGHSVDPCEGICECTRSQNRSDQLNDNCDQECSSSKASTTKTSQSMVCGDEGCASCGTTSTSSQSDTSASSDTTTTGTSQSVTHSNHECGSSNATTVKTNLSDDSCKNDYATCNASSENRNDSSRTSMVQSNQSVRGSTVPLSVSSRESINSNDLCLNTSFKAPVKIKVLSTNPDYQPNTLVVREQLNKLLSERNNAKESHPKMSKDNFKTGQVIYADVCFVKSCVASGNGVTKTVDSVTNCEKSSNGCVKTTDSVTSKPKTAEVLNKYAASEPGSDTGYGSSQLGESENSYFSSYKENPCYSGNEKNNPEPGQYECTASVCSDDLPRSNVLKKFGNGYKRSVPPNPKLKHCTSMDSRAGLIHNLNQRLKGTYLSPNYPSHRSRQSISSRCSPVSEYPTDAESNTYTDVTQPQCEDNEPTNRSPARTGMQKFLPRIKQYMAKRKKSNSLGSEDAYYNDPSSPGNGAMKICQDCLNHIPNDVGETLKSQRSTLANSKTFRGRSVVHLDEIYKLYPNLCSDLPSKVKSALSRSTENLTNAKCSHLCQHYERGRELRWSELSSSFENIRCLN